MTKPRIRVPAVSRAILPTPSVEIEIALPPVRLPAARPPRNHRFKVQQRVELKARDHLNKPFLLGEIWRTVSHADKQATAERLFTNVRREHPGREYRIAEEWPFGSNLRVIK